MKINTNNKIKIESELYNIQSKCTARLIDYDDVLDAIGKADAKIASLGISKKYRNDCIVSILPEQVSNSYEYSAEGTFATLKRFSSGWFLVSCSRRFTGSTSGGANSRSTLTLSETAKQNIPYTFSV